MNKGKLYKVAHGGARLEVIDALNEALKNFPAPSAYDYFKSEDILQWLIRWFGKIPDHVESQLNQAFVEYLKAHLGDGEDGTAY